jgi:hypothetical protein
VLRLPAIPWNDSSVGYRREPFFELITLPEGNDVAVGTRISGKLYHDFLLNAAKMKRGFQRIWADSQLHQRPKRRDNERTPVKTARRLATGLGGIVVGADGDPESLNWKW